MCNSGDGKRQRDRGSPGYTTGQRKIVAWLGSVDEGLFDGMTQNQFSSRFCTRATQSAPGEFPRASVRSDVRSPSSSQAAAGLRSSPPPSKATIRGTNESRDKNKIDSLEVEESHSKTDSSDGGSSVRGCSCTL